MPLPPKTAVLQMRVDPQLLMLFQEACYARNDTSSASIRQYMAREVEAYRVHLAKKDIATRKAQEALAGPTGASVSDVSQKSPVVASGKPEGAVSKRMRLKKEVKLRGMVDDDLDDD